MRASSPKFLGGDGLAIVPSAVHLIPSYPALSRQDNTYSWNEDDRWYNQKENLDDIASSPRKPKTNKKRKNSTDGIAPDSCVRFRQESVLDCNSPNNFGKTPSPRGSHCRYETDHPHDEVIVGSNLFFQTATYIFEYINIDTGVMFSLAAT